MAYNLSSRDATDEHEYGVAPAEYELLEPDDTLPAHSLVHANGPNNNKEGFQPTSDSDNFKLQPGEAGADVDAVNYDNDGYEEVGEALYQTISVDDKVPNNRVPNNQVPNNQVPNNQVPNNQVPNNQVPNKQVPTMRPRQNTTDNTPQAPQPRNKVPKHARQAVNPAEQNNPVSSGGTLPQKTKSKSNTESTPKEITLPRYASVKKVPVHKLPPTPKSEPAPKPEPAPSLGVFAVARPKGKDSAHDTVPLKGKPSSGSTSGLSGSLSHSHADKIQPSHSDSDTKANQLPKVGKKVARTLMKSLFLTDDMSKPLRRIDMYANQCYHEAFKDVTERGTDADDGMAFVKLGIQPNVTRSGVQFGRDLHRNDHTAIKGRVIPIRPRQTWTRDASVSIFTLLHASGRNRYVRLVNGTDEEDEIELGTSYNLDDPALNKKLLVIDTSFRGATMEIPTISTIKVKKALAEVQINNLKGVVQNLLSQATTEGRLAKRTKVLGTRHSQPLMMRQFIPIYCPGTEEKVKAEKLRSSMITIGRARARVTQPDVRQSKAVRC